MLTTSLKRVEPGGRYKQICEQWTLREHESVAVNLLDALRIWRDRGGLFLMDFHGTLASKRGLLDERTLRGLHVLRARGYLTGVVTGAERAALQYWEDSVDVVAYCQGSLLTREKKVFAVHCIVNMNRVLERIQSVPGLSVHQVCAVTVDGEQLALEIITKTRQKELHQVANLLTQERLHVTQADWGHIGPRTKALAIDEIRETLGVAKDCPTVFLGNATNDNDALDVSVGFVPHNALPEVKQHAAFVLPDVAPQFTAEFLDLLTRVLQGGSS